MTQDFLKHLLQHVWVVAVFINDSAVVFSLVSVYDCLAPGDLCRLSNSAELGPIFICSN